MGTGKRIQHLRIDKGWTQSRLLTELHRVIPHGRVLARPTLSSVENDERLPTAWILIALADVLNTTTDYLLCLSDDPHPQSGATVELAPYPELIEKLNALDESTEALILDTFYTVLDLTTSGPTAVTEEVPADTVPDNIIQLTAPPQTLEDFLEYFDSLPDEIKDIVFEQAERSRSASDSRQSHSNQSRRSDSGIS